MTLPPIVLAAIGDAESPATWSGIPYHFLHAARTEGLPIIGLPVDLDRSRSHWLKARWALQRLGTLRSVQGLQYSEAFLRALWASAPTPAPGTVLMNCSQIYPKRIAGDPGFRRTFFLDQTLRQLFNYYEHHVASDIRRSAIARERAQYSEADAILMQSRWAANDVIGVYGIDPAKVHVVIPGANLDPAALAAWDVAHQTPRIDRSGPLILGFVGKDWARKGLDRLIAALSIARAGGVDAELHVVGCDPQSLPSKLAEAPGVRWLGFVDKRQTPAKFLEILSRFDIGCLASQREAGGISLLEFARLGIPTIAPDTGGAPEYAVADASSLILPQDTPERIAAAVSALASDRTVFARQRENAWCARHQADWRRAAREVGDIMEALT